MTSEERLDEILGNFSRHLQTFIKKQTDPNEDKVNMFERIENGAKNGIIYTVYGPAYFVISRLIGDDDPSMGGMIAMMTFIASTPLKPITVPLGLVVGAPIGITVGLLSGIAKATQNFGKYIFGGDENSFESKIEKVYGKLQECRILVGEKPIHREWGTDSGPCIHYIVESRPFYLHLYNFLKEQNRCEVQEINDSIIDYFNLKETDYKDVQIDIIKLIFSTEHFGPISLEKFFSLVKKVENYTIKKDKIQLLLTIHVILKYDERKEIYKKALM
ncbi:hypothetical protein OAG24_00690 [bacterium]|nr:hypothetical protein [bacterium]